MLEQGHQTARPRPGDAEALTAEDEKCYGEYAKLWQAIVKDTLGEQP